MNISPPSGRKWAADDININLYIPSGTFLKFEKNPKILLRGTHINESHDYLKMQMEINNTVWVMTENRLDHSDPFCYDKNHSLFISNKHIQ